ncbi:hypothetical protein C2845_PM05G15220 [Panicum miliaceum]|uniref:Uncharacterized protein n=1 Tax=Panicum miliaceum TaxID=4540 RepID=A0A3L6SVY7_PANMI|nr:hypothetical protein C2845_PM05G15220 [Panicum miliaceum]
MVLEDMVMQDVWNPIVIDRDGSTAPSSPLLQLRAQERLRGEAPGHPVQEDQGHAGDAAGGDAKVRACGAACSARAWCCRTWASSTRARKKARRPSARMPRPSAAATSLPVPASKAPSLEAPVRRQGRRTPERVDASDRVSGLVVPVEGQSRRHRTGAGRGVEDPHPAPAFVSSGTERRLLGAGLLVRRARTWLLLSPMWCAIVVVRGFRIAAGELQADKRATGRET